MSDEPALHSNVPEFSVSLLAQSLKRTLEDTYGRVRVRGELGRVTIPRSGHLYTTLKDEDANIDAVCWKGSLSRLAVKPEEGLEVICTGRITTYPASSKYQLIIESMELAGEGALLKMLEERKKRLASEGLFAPERKKPLPFLPQVIGVVTSPTGAVIRDILHRLNDRFPRHVLLWPVMVQGQGAAEQIASAINGFQSLSEKGLPRPDVLIVARGGGSLEDLMPFNEEVVVRAIAASQIPVISAVGHETDTTLSDYAADLRAPTPTGAAEMVVPVRAQLHAQILDTHSRLFNGLSRSVTEKTHKLEALSAKLGDPTRLLESKMQKLDHLTDKIAGCYQSYLHTKNRHLIQTSTALKHPQDILMRGQHNLQRWSETLETVGQRWLRDKTTHLEHLQNMLEAYSFKNVLKRGYAVVRDENGHIINSPDELSLSTRIDIEFSEDRRVQAQICAPNQTEKQSNLFDS